MIGQPPFGEQITKLKMVRYKTSTDDRQTGLKLCKDALVANKWDVEQAVRWIKKRNLHHS